MPPPNTSKPRRKTGSTRAAKGAAAVATAALVAVGAGTAPAQSAPSTECPDTYPAADVAPDQAVTGLTVTRGSTPDPFTGVVLGTLTNGIGPGTDMILVRLSSPRIDEVGIWEGMSGSPVYAADGRLIGAVSYGLGVGPSTVAGVTPAAQMRELIGGPAASLSGGAAPEADIPTRLGRQLVADGEASRSEVNSGMNQLEVPLSVSGVGSQKRFDQLAERLRPRGIRLVRVGATSQAANDATGDDIVAGGNLAASISYGDVTAAGVGTATMVCGTDVVGFGHPMLWTGPSTLTMHGADAVFIQEDPTVAGFKVANIGAPVGTIDQDRWTGIAGFTGATPATSSITSTVQMGARSRTGTTRVSVPDFVPDIAFSHLISNADALFDGVGEGSAHSTWTVRGTRGNGSPFTISHTDLYADQDDLTFATVVDLVDLLYALQFNGAEDVTIKSVTASYDLSRAYDHFVIKKAWVRKAGRWVRLRRGHLVTVKAAPGRQFKVFMASISHGTKTVTTKVDLPRTMAGRAGALTIFGGNHSAGYDEFGGSYSQSEPTVGQIIAGVGKEPKNSAAVVDASFYNWRGGVILKRRVERANSLVVDGRMAMPLRVRR